MSRTFEYIELPHELWRCSVKVRSTGEQVGVITHYRAINKVTFIAYEPLTIGELERILEFMKRFKPTDSVQQPV